MVVEVFHANFDAGLKLIEKNSGNKTAFEARAEVFSNEVVLAVTLAQAGKLAATTVYASCDFDPQASAPTVQDLLSACVDAAGTFFGNHMDGSVRTEQLLDQSVSALEDAPFDWTPVQIEKFQIFLRVDKSNPGLENLADDWLAKTDQFRNGSRGKATRTHCRRSAQKKRNPSRFALRTISNQRSKIFALIIKLALMLSMILRRNHSRLRQSSPPSSGRIRSLLRSLSDSNPVESFDVLVGYFTLARDVIQVCSFRWVLAFIFPVLRNSPTGVPAAPSPANDLAAY